MNEATDTEAPSISPSAATVCSACGGKGGRWRHEGASIAPTALIWEHCDVCKTIPLSEHRRAIAMLLGEESVPKEWAKRLLAALKLAHGWMGDGDGKNANPVSFTEDILFVEEIMRSHEVLLEQNA